MILVLGATGTTGGEVARQLIAAGHTPRLLVRDPGKVQGFRDKAEIVQGDLDRPDSMVPALRGAEKLYLVSTGANGPELEANVIAAAQKTSVKHVVKLSVLGADNPVLLFSRWHATSEKRLVESGLTWTMLRPTNFMSNALGWAETIKSQGSFFQPTGDGRWAAVDPADIAAVAVQALTNSGHEGKAYTLTGPESHSAAEYGATLSSVLGKPVTFVDIPLEAARQNMLKSLPPAHLEAVIDLLSAMKTNKVDVVTNDVAKVTGRTAGTFEAWARRNVAAFR